MTQAQTIAQILDFKAGDREVDVVEKIRRRVQ